MHEADLESRRQKIQDLVDNAEPYKPNGKGSGEDLFGWVEGFELTEAEVAEIDDPTWVYTDLLIQGHILVLCGHPNAGKTRIMTFVAAEAAASGYQVIYINADVSGSDAKAMHVYAQENGFRMLFPDLKVGKNVNDIMSRLQDLADGSANLSEYVVIIDTYKKVTSMMDKKVQGLFYKLLRKLTGRGMTIVLNAHANKHNGADGLPIYEGVNEIRTETDELIYLVATKDEQTGIQTVSTIPDKQRGRFRPITFEIAPDLTVTRSDEYVDVLTEAKEAARHEADADLIARVCKLLEAGPMNQSEIVRVMCSGKDRLSRPTIRRVLRTYGGGSRYRHWHTTCGFQNNETRYGLAPWH
jgi:hypothetical protein